MENGNEKFDKKEEKCVEDSDHANDTKESPVSSSSTSSKVEIAVRQNAVLSPDGNVPPIPVASSSPLPKSSSTVTIDQSNNATGTDPDQSPSCVEYTVPVVIRRPKMIKQSSESPSKRVENNTAGNMNKRVDPDIENILEEEEQLSEAEIMNEVEDTVLLSASMESTTSNFGSKVNRPNTYCETPFQDGEIAQIEAKDARKKNVQEEHLNDEVIDESSSSLDGNRDKAKDKAKRKLNYEERGRKRVSTTKRAGLVLSVSRINRRIKAGRYAKRVGLTSGVYLAAVLEYLVAEVLELAGNCARYFRKHRIFPRCIQLTLLHDKELFSLTKGAIVPQGGVKPFIHPALQPRNSHYSGQVVVSAEATSWE